MQIHNILPYAAVIGEISAQKIPPRQIRIICHFDELTKRSDVINFSLCRFSFIFEQLQNEDCNKNAV